MSSTLCIRRTPKPKDEDWHFKLPIKGLIGRRFYDHDGSLGGAQITIGPEELPWFEGILSAGNFEKKEAKDLAEIVEHLRKGGSIDVWFEV